MKGKFHGVLSLHGVDEEIYKRKFVTDMCRKNFPINSFFLKRSCMFLKDFIEVADTHTCLRKFIGDCAKLNDKKLNNNNFAFLPLFELLMDQGFRQV